MTFTRVVNLRCEAFEVYIGRAGRGEDGYFGNPYRVGSTCQSCGVYHPTAESTRVCYTNYFQWRMSNDAQFYWRVVGLKGRVLGCFCKPGFCHGDVIATWLDSW